MVAGAEAVGLEPTRREGACHCAKENWTRLRQGGGVSRGRGAKESAGRHREVLLIMPTGAKLQSGVGKDLSPLRIEDGKCHESVNSGVEVCTTREIECGC